MNVGIRFSSPLLDENDIKLLTSSFGNSTDEVVKVLETAPYEISVLACLIKRLENFIGNKK